MRTAHLFAGMGGSHLAGFLLDDPRDEAWESVLSVEKDPKCLAILRKQLPDEPIHDDVTTLSGVGLDADLVISGFPCTNLSTAGRGAGLVEGSASSLFFHALRIADECQAPYFFIENVGGFLSNKEGQSFEIALRSLQGEGYGDVAWITNRAVDVGAPHYRMRVWMLARRTGRGITGSWERPSRWGTRGMLQENTLEVFEKRLPPAGEYSVWPTMRASDYKGVGGIGSKSQAHMFKRRYLTPVIQDVEQRSGKLNPRWCSALMGWPIGWTEGITSDLMWPAEEGMWPSLPDDPQQDWEPPRLVAPYSKDKTRAPQIRALGNAWVPPQAVAAWRELTGDFSPGGLLL